MEPSAIVDFLTIAGKLKRAVRTGWVLRNVKEPESVAEHSWRMALMSILLSEGTSTTDVIVDCQEKRPLHVDRMMRIGLVHDLAEAIVGDITPFCNVSKEEKHRMEREAMQFLATSLGESASGKAAAEALLTSYGEYEAGLSPEAILVKDFDKAEMVTQALEYELEQPNVDLGSFFEGIKGKVRTELVRSWIDEVVARRQKLLTERKAAAAADSEGQRPSAPSSTFMRMPETKSTHAPVGHANHTEAGSGVASSKGWKAGPKLLSQQLGGVILPLSIGLAVGLSAGLLLSKEAARR